MDGPAIAPTVVLIRAPVEATPRDAAALFLNFSPPYVRAPVAAMPRPYPPQASKPTPTAW